MSRLWMVSYDISDNKSRRLVHDELKNHGERIQFSIFECNLTDREMTLLRMRVAELLDEGDSVRWYPLCQWCRETIDWQGTGWATGDDDFFVV